MNNVDAAIPSVHMPLAIDDDRMAAELGLTKPSAKVPFVSHTAERVIGNPVQGQTVRSYDVLLAAFGFAAVRDKTRLDRNFNIPLSSGSGKGAITAFTGDYTSLPSAVSTKYSQLGGVEDSYSAFDDAPTMTIPFIDLAIGDPMLNDVVNSIISVRVLGSSCADTIASRKLDSTLSPGFDTGVMAFHSARADMKLRIYPYIIVGTEAVYTPLEIVTVGGAAANKPTYIAVEIEGVTGLASITIPSVQGDAIRETIAGIEASLTI
jgi:hypothetical protein